MPYAFVRNLIVGNRMVVFEAIVFGLYQPFHGPTRQYFMGT